MSKMIGAALLSSAMFLISASAFGSPPTAVLSTVKTYSLGESPESIAIDKAGNSFVSIGNTIRKRTPAGVESTFMTLPIAAFVLGVKVGPDGCVYNTSTSLDPAVVGAFIWKTCTAGAPTIFATLDPSGGPNDLAFDDRRNLFVTDPFLGKVYKITTAGAVSTWLQHPLLNGNTASPYLLFHAVGVDGLAFDEDKENLYLGNLDYGRLIRVPVRYNGSAGTPVVVASDPKLAGIDGFAFDHDGTIFAAINGQDHFVSISSSGVITDLYAGLPLDGPSSVAFGTTPGTQKTLYIISGAFLRTFGLQSGTPHPAMLSTPTEERGLCLP